MIKRAGSFLRHHIGFVCVAAVLVYCVVHAFDPPRLNWGDSYSDYNVMTAGRNFQKYGFLKMRLTPVLLDASLVTQNDAKLIYTHYPQLPDLMNGVLRAVFHLSTLAQFRLVALMFSFGALFFVYRLLEHYWSRDIAQIGLALWVMNPLWVQHADYLHHVPYLSFFGFGGVYLLVQYLKRSHPEGTEGSAPPAVPTRKPWVYLLGASVFLFVLFTASYDGWFFVPLLYAFAAIAHHQRINRHVVIALGVPAAFAVAAMLFKFGTNVWALGGVASFVRDLHFQWVERAAGPAAKIPFTTGVWPTIVGRVERCFSLLLFPVALFWLAAPFIRQRLPRLASLGPNPGFLFLAALPFLWMFVQLWILQYYPTLLVLPFYAVACAAAISLLAGSTTRMARVAAAVLFAALIGNSVDETLRFKKAFFDPSAIRSLRAQLDSLSAPGQFIMVNHMWDSAYGYFFDRNTVLLSINPPERIDAALRYYTDPKKNRVAPATGAIFVQHKHLADELIDKGFYYVAAREGLWNEWAEPERYRARIKTVIDQRDSLLVDRVSRIGHRVYDSDYYALWVIPPRTDVSRSNAGTPGPSHQN